MNINIKRFVFIHRKIVIPVFRIVITAITIVLPNLFVDTGTMLQHVVISLVGCVLLLTLLTLIERLDKWSTREMILLHRLLNACLKRKIYIKNVSRHLIDSKEKEIPECSEVHLLVNDIKNYDLTSVAIDVISQNIRRNVKYIYYAPDSDDLNRDFIALQKYIGDKIYETLCQSLAPDLAKSMKDELLTDHLLVFKLANENEFVYNFSYLVTPEREVYSAWYLSDQDMESETLIEDDNSVLLINLIGSEKDDLKMVIRTILQSDDTICAAGKETKQKLIASSLLF